MDLTFGSAMTGLNFIFIFAGVVDYYIRKLMMTACSVMLDPIK